MKRILVIASLAALAADAPSLMTSEEKLIFQNIALRQQLLQRDYAEAYDAACGKRGLKREECIVDDSRGIVMRKPEPPKPEPPKPQ